MQEIVLYGAGIGGEKFYYRYKNKYKIKYVIDQNAGRFFHNIPVYNFIEKKKELKDLFIVVAVESAYAYTEIAQLLNENGFEEFKDYRWGRDLGKKVAILYGNCHIWTLGAYLIANPEFSRAYELRQYYVGDKQGGIPEHCTLKVCELFMAQDILSNNKLGIPGVEELIKNLNKNCKKIIFPNLFGCNLFYPQANELDENVIEKHINENAVNDDGKRSLVYWIRGWRDKNIEQMYERGGEIKTIAKKLETEDFYCVDAIREQFSCQIDKLIKRENTCDIKISDFILKNYQKQRTFYDPNHPAHEVIYEKGRRILNLLGMAIDESVPCIGKNDGGEMPIYGCVRRALGLKFRQKYLRQCNPACSIYDTAITIEEYVNNYILWHYA